jgi:hypothetical protein
VLTITQERGDVAESARDKLYADLWGGLRFSLNERSYKYFFVLVMTQFHLLDSGVDEEARIFPSAFYRNVLSYGIITTSSSVPGGIYETYFPLAYTRAIRKVNSINIFVVFYFCEELVLYVYFLSTFYLSDIISKILTVDIFVIVSIEAIFYIYTL